jgi:hypothetical protein
MQVASSLVMKEFLNYRLTKTIPWFLTVIGGFQDAMTVGLVASMQTWKYRTKKMPAETRYGYHEALGPISFEHTPEKVIEDKPWVDLFPVENIRFDPAAHWYDVVATSPYIILQIPMYVSDVLENMDTADREGRKWKDLSKEIVLQARVKDMDPLRAARNDGKEDREALTSEANEFDVVMVHLNFIKNDGETYAYYTLKDEHLLSEPMLLEEMFKHCKDGRPPVQIGFCVLETHKPVPTSLSGLGAELQNETNEVANQRLDNVKYVLNKRSIVRRGANVDIESLLRNVPGGVTMANDVERDIREVSWPDVTSSSYQEQDRINVDMDELVGNFAQGSVMTNRKLNETVGGMRIMAQGANMLTEYTIRVFVETWVEPVLRQLIIMEQTYETDQVVLAVAAQKAKLFQRFGMNQVTDQMLAQELTLSVNVGMGATDPDTRLQRFMQTIGMYNQLSTQGSPDQNLPEIRKQLFGLAGFKDSARFFNPKIDPRIQKAMQMMQQAEGLAQKFVEQHKDRLIRRDAQLDDRERNLNVEQMRLVAEKEIFKILQKAQQQADAGEADMIQATADMAIDQAAASVDRHITLSQHAQEMQRKDEEFAQKMRHREPMPRRSAGSPPNNRRGPCSERSRRSAKRRGVSGTHREPESRRRARWRWRPRSPGTCATSRKAMSGATWSAARSRTSRRPTRSSWRAGRGAGGAFSSFKTKSVSRRCSCRTCAT